MLSQFHNSQNRSVVIDTTSECRFILSNSS